MKTGFWLEADEQKDVTIDELFQDNDELIYIYEFLFEYCEAFAASLNQHFGYKVEYLYDDNGNLVYTYCVLNIGGKMHYIDIRGVTDDWNEFIEKFNEYLPDVDRQKLNIKMYGHISCNNNEKITNEANNIAAMYRHYYT